MPTRARPRTRTATASKRARQLLGRWSPPRRIDLTTVRAVLVPATMTLLGDWNWRGWLPRRARGARLSGDEALEAQCAGKLCHALLFGPTPVAEAIDRIQEMHANASGRVFYYERVLLSNLAYLRAEQGCFDVARKSLARAKALAEAFGSEVDVAAMAGFYGAKVERFAGNLERAEAELRLAYEILERLGEKGTRSVFAAHLADILVDQGRLEEAEDFLRISNDTAARDNLHSRVPLRLIRARIDAQRGNADDAEQLVHEALSLLEGTDDLNALGDALLSLASVLSMAGKTAEGMSAVEESLRLFDKKGNAVTAQRTRARLAAGSPRPSRVRLDPRP